MRPSCSPPSARTSSGYGPASPVDTPPLTDTLNSTSFTVCHDTTLCDWWLWALDAQAAPACHSAGRSAAVLACAAVPACMHEYACVPWLRTVPGAALHLEQSASVTRNSCGESCTALDATCAPWMHWPSQHALAQIPISAAELACAQEGMHARMHLPFTNADHGSDAVAGCCAQSQLASFPLLFVLCFSRC